MDNKSDIQLVEAYFSGQSQALEVLISRYLQVIYKFVYAHVQEAAIAEDLTQEVFVKMWRHLQKFSEHRSFKAWLYRIAKNQLIDFWRQKKVTPFTALENDYGYSQILAELKDFNPSALETLAVQERIQSLQQALSRLSLADQEVLILHYQSELTFKEIAEFSGESLNTVKSRSRRAVLELRRLLA